MTIKLKDLDRERQTAILNASLKEFAKRGYDQASTNAIAKEAGISKPLMFHYIGSKQELFLFVYDYFSALLNKEYYERISYDEKDIFIRLQQSYLLQFHLLKQYPWAFAFHKLGAKTKDAFINEELKKRKQDRQKNCLPSLFDNIDHSMFKPELNTETSCSIIYWSCTGFGDHLLEDIRNGDALDETMIKRLDEFFSNLRQTFYKPERNRL